ncbi:MAG: YeeE/YedE family protein [Pseudomonadota bacterium]
MTAPEHPESSASKPLATGVTVTGAGAAAQHPMTQWRVVAMAGAGLLGLMIATTLTRWGAGAGEALRYGAGAALGGFAGIALYHAAFGFTGAWRRLVRERRGAGLRAQMLLIAIACTMSFPLLGYEDVTGLDLHPVIMPMSAASALGAFVFGIGMQLGGGCASGTLFTAGGGSTRNLVSLVFFIAGSVWATAHIPTFWRDFETLSGIPTLPAMSAVRDLGVAGALMLLALGTGAVWAITVLIERRAHGTLENPRRTQSLVGGPWSLTTGALGLVIVSIGCLMLFQRPWGITAGFALWGAVALDTLGSDVASWPYWQGWRAAQLEAGLLADRTSVMNIGIVLGAFAAAGLAGRFKPEWNLPFRSLLIAALGGLMMGYGARLAFGCNIGAYLGGLVSGSAHGLWWLFWGFLGSYAGTWARVILSMDPPWGARAELA